jgi:hypothetical protein
MHGALLPLLHMTSMALCLIKHQKNFAFTYTFIFDVIIIIIIIGSTALGGPYASSNK